MPASAAVNGPKSKGRRCPPKERSPSRLRPPRIRGMTIAAQAKGAKKKLISEIHMNGRLAIVASRTDQ
jgi:hypothetical protein